MSECRACGQSIEGVVKFCPECGGSFEANEHADEPKKKPKFLMLGGLLLLAVAGGGAVYAIQSGSFVVKRQLAITPLKLFASRATNVRSKPTKDSAELGQLTRGMTISGVEVVGIDPTSAWIKISDGKFVNGYVSKTNLVPDQPVKIDTSGAGQMTLSIGTEVRAKPDESSPVIENLSEGESIDGVGKTETGWIEIAPKGGGVGYVQAKAFEQVVQYSEDGSLAKSTPNHPSGNLCESIIGHWRSVNYSKLELDIEKDESLYVVHATTEYPTMAGTCENGVLDIIGRKSIYRKSSDTFLFFGNEFTR